MWILAHRFLSLLGQEASFQEAGVVSWTAAQCKPMCTASRLGVVGPHGSALQAPCLQRAQGNLHRASAHGVNIPGCLPLSFWRAASLVIKYPKQAGKDVTFLSENKSVIVASVFVVSHWRKMCSHLACAFMAFLSGRWLNLWVFPCSLTNLFQHMAKLWKANINHAMYKMLPIHRFTKCPPSPAFDWKIKISC